MASSVLVSRTLGFLSQSNTKFPESVSKIEFIKLLKELGIVEKTERGLYKNLQVLEKKKLIAYENKFLKLTQKGLKSVTQKEKEIFPYLKLIVKIGSTKEKTKSAQTYFK